MAARTPQAFLGIDHDGQASIVETRGNPNCHLVMRGGRSGTNYDARSIALAQDALRKADAPSNIVVDCSHGNSNKDHTRQHIAFEDVVAQRNAGNASLIGAMLESNINPGAQKLGPDPAALDYGRLHHRFLHRLGGNGELAGVGLRKAGLTAGLINQSMVAGGRVWAVLFPVSDEDDGYAAILGALAVGVGYAGSDDDGARVVAAGVAQDPGAARRPVHIVVVQGEGYFGDHIDGFRG